MDLQRYTRNSLPFVEEFTKDGLLITVANNSELAPLLRAALNVTKTEVGQPVREFLESQGDYKDCHDCDYATMSLAYKEELADLVKGHIRISKQVANLVEDAFKRIEEYKAKREDDDPVAKFRIIQDPFPQMFQHVRFEEFLKDVPPTVQEPNSYLTHKPLGENTLLGMITAQLKIDAEGMVQSLSYFAIDDEGHQRNVLEDIYMGFFTGMKPRHPYYNLYEISKLPAGERMVVALAAWIIAGYLYENVPNDAQGDLHSFRKNCLDLKGCMHRVMVQAHAEKLHQVDNGVLVIDMRPSDFSIVLDSTSYEVFLDAGGSPEIILGAKVAGLGLYRSEEFAEHSEECIRAWNNYCLYANVNNANDRLQFMRAIYKAVWDEYSDPLDFEEEWREEYPSVWAQAFSNCFKYIDSLTVEDADDIHSVLSHMFGTIRFGFTAAPYYMREINLARRKNPEADVRELASVATIKYLITYFLEHLDVKQLEA